MSNRNFGFSFPWKKALGITFLKLGFTRKIGIPTSKVGLKKKIESAFLKMLFGKK